jgi:hypothetical protein
MALLWSLALLTAIGAVEGVSPLPPLFDVTKYGAVGDGKTDDTVSDEWVIAARQRCVAVPAGAQVAVESTVNQLFTSPIGGAVYFPPGKYLFSGSPQPTPAGSAFINIAALGGSAAAPSQFGVIGAGQGDVTLMFACRAGGLINIRGQTGAPSSQLAARGAR